MAVLHCLTTLHCYVIWQHCIASLHNSAACLHYNTLHYCVTWVQCIPLHHSTTLYGVSTLHHTLHDDIALLRYMIDYITKLHCMPTLHDWNVLLRCIHTCDYYIALLCYIRTLHYYNTWVRYMTIFLCYLTTIHCCGAWLHYFLHCYITFLHYTTTLHSFITLPYLVLPCVAFPNLPYLTVPSYLILPALHYIVLRCVALHDHCRLHMHLRLPSHYT